MSCKLGCSIFARNAIFTVSPSNPHPLPSPPHPLHPGHCCGSKNRPYSSSAASPWRRKGGRWLVAFSCHIVLEKKLFSSKSRYDEANVGHYRDQLFVAQFLKSLTDFWTFTSPYGPPILLLISILLYVDRLGTGMYDHTALLCEWNYILFLPAISIVYCF